MPTTASVQIKITLPLQLQKFVQQRANQYGLTLSTYIKHLVLDDAKDMALPTFKMSEPAEKVLNKALTDHAEGKTHKIDDIDEFLNTL